MYYDHKGNAFNTGREMCNYWGIPYHRYLSGKKSGKDLCEILEGIDRQYKSCVDHKGNRFKSVLDMCNHWGITRGSYDARIRYGWSIEKALETPVAKPKFVEDHLGNKFRSTTEMCDYWGITYSALRGKLHRGKSLEQALTEGKIGSGCIRTEVVVFGMTFDSLNSTSKYFKLSPKILNYRLSNPYTELEIAVILPSNDKRSISVKFIGLNNKAYYKVPWSTQLVTTRQIVEYYRPDLLEVYDKYNPTGEYRPYNKGGKSDG